MVLKMVLKIKYKNKGVKSGCERVLGSSNQTPQFNISVQNKRVTPFQPSKSLTSTPKTPQFNTPSVQHPLSSTHPSVSHTTQLNTPLSSTPNKRQYVKGFWCGIEGCVKLKGVWKWGVCWTEGCVELRGYWCWTEGLWGLKRRGPFVLNLCVEVRGGTKEPILTVKDLWILKLRDMKSGKYFKYQF